MDIIISLYNSNKYMPTKIKFVITFLVVLITILIFYKHYLLNELIK